MAHVRQQVRDLMVAVLSPHYTTFSSRVYPLGSTALPAILVYTRDESSEVLSMGYPRTLEKSLQVIVEVFQTGSSDTIDDILDDISVTVENTLSVPNELYKDLFLTNCVIDFTDDGERPLGIATLTYQVIYHTDESNAEVSI